jgi:cytochrome c oxidase subunit 2
MRQTAHVVEPAEFERWVREQAAGGAQGGGGEETAGGAAPDGKTVFTENGCGGCHALADAGAEGGTGPDLDETLADEDAAFIEESIVDPDAEIAEGFEAGLMPKMYEQTIQGREREALVEYLDEVSGR